MTLNTFHNSGISAKNVTLGVPRLNEILSVSKSMRTPSLTVYLRDEICHDEQEANDLQMKIGYMTLGDVTVKTEIHYDPDPRTTIVDEDNEFVNEYFQMPDENINPDNMSPWVLRIILNDQVFHNKKLTMDEISTMITERFDRGVHVIYSDDNASQLVLRVRIIISPEDRHGEADSTALGSEDDEILRRMQVTLLDNLFLRGVRGIKKVYLSHKKKPRWSDSKGFEDEPKEWIIETDGSNLGDVILFPDVDHTRTISNDVNEMFAVLGVEGARSSLYFELNAVLSFDGSSVNYRHIACLADCMTYSGTILAVSRHGISKGESGPMLRASFEETVEVFMKAAAFSQYDFLDGVTENVMLGQLARVGSGMVDLLMDPTKLKDAFEYQTEGTYGSKRQYEQYESIDTPSYGTPSIGTPMGDIFGSTPGVGMFTPSINTPAYMTPWGNDGNTPSRSPASPFIGILSPHYTPDSANAYSSSSPSYHSTSNYGPKRYTASS
jgi:DNA-directed RNA polymerase II subunit RPB1